MCNNTSKEEKEKEEKKRKKEKKSYAICLKLGETRVIVKIIYIDKSFNGRYVHMFTTAIACIKTSIL